MSIGKGVMAAWCAGLFACVAILLFRPLITAAGPWFVRDSLSFELAKGLPAAFVALVVGAIAAGIAFRQMAIARAKLKLDLFDKRIAVYDAISTALRAPGDDSAGFPPDLHSKAAFLFGQEVGHYVIDIQMKLWRFRELELASAEKMYPNEATEAKKVERTSLRAWFAAEATAGLHQRLKPFLDFEAWR